MSALLPVSAKELNLCAEYGYSSRVFRKYFAVHEYSNYCSALFLVYRQLEPLKHRNDRYRDHFAIYCNSDSICIARTKTTIFHPDNDAIILYDVIKPKNGVDDRLRSKYKQWSISFDRIEYSSEMPDFLTYRLIGTGEWWYFDDGYILNGLTSYDKLTRQCESLFVYYEMHAQYKIDLPQNQTISNIPPHIQVSATPNASNTDQQQPLTSLTTPFNNVLTTSSVSPSSGLLRLHTQNHMQPTRQSQIQVPTSSIPFNGDINATYSNINNNNASNNNNNNVQNDSSSDVMGRQEEPTTSSQPPQPSSSLLSSPPPQPPSTIEDLISRITPANINGRATTTLADIPAPLQQQPPSMFVNSIPSTLLPNINASLYNGLGNSHANGFRSNHAPQLQKTMFKSVMPSLFWFDERQKELELGNIDYFKTYNHVPPT